MKRTIRVLHLEDRQHDAELIGQILENAQVFCNIVWVKGKEEFEAMASQRSFDLILCDYNLPGYNGLAALRFVRARGIEIPVIMISGFLGEDEAVECLTNGATDYLLKQRLARLPSSVDRALQIAEEQLQRKRTEFALRESERFFRAVVDAVPSSIGVLDECGKVIAINKAWRNSVGTHSPRWLCSEIEADYIEGCERAAASGDEGASLIVRGFRDIFACRATEFEARIQFSSPTVGLKQFLCRLTRFPEDGPVRVAVSHLDITGARKMTAQSLACGSTC